VVDRRREVGLTVELVGSLFAHAEDLGDVNDSKELPARHSSLHSKITLYTSIG
jgi:hypothetical protein